MTKQKYQIPHALFTPRDDAFYFAEATIDKIVEPLGKDVMHLTGSHIKLQTIHKRDKLRKTILWMEHKLHATHSPIQKVVHFERTFHRMPYFQTPIQKIRRRLKHGI
jgi:hypothetical protein